MGIQEKCVNVSACVSLWCRFQSSFFSRGVPAQASASGGPGECWSKARTEHETDRKQIELEPAAINHRGGAGPSHSSRTRKTRTAGNEMWQHE